jgi:transposase
LGRKTKFSIDLNLNHIKIKNVKRDKNGSYHIHVASTATSATCEKCNKRITKSHGQCKETIIEHIPILEEQVFIHVKWPRFVCTDCDDGPTTSFHPDWLNETGNMTKGYERFCLKTLINSTIKDTAIKLCSTEEKIQGIVNRNIVTKVDWTKLNPTKIGIDEIAIKKGHGHYLTIISDISIPKKASIIAVLDGRKKNDVVPFLKTIPRDKLLKLESICADMGAGFLSSFKDVINDIYVFNDVVTIDRFHVAKLIGTAVDKERKIITKELKKEYSQDETTLERIKNTMWPFRHHFDDLNPDQQEQLDSLFLLSPYLENCYDLREELYLIFEGKYSKEEARAQIKNWITRAETCKREDHFPFASFIKTYDNFKENILNYFDTRASSGPVEGLNNKIKTIKRRGFGFNNVFHFAQRLFLDINLKFDLLPNCY